MTPTTYSVTSEPQFTVAGLEVQLRLLEKQVATRQQAKRTIGQIRRIAERSYGVTFEADTPLSERVLLPAMSAEAKGVEDARFVRFCDEDGSLTYYASYTAFNGTDIGQQLLETRDFLHFTSGPMAGAAAANKGLALFPRRLNGRFAALSRSDRESNTIAYSGNPRLWEQGLACQTPLHSWEVVQLGNCGSPIETAAGWLVLTHGVGPMRTYSIGAILLDLEDPTQIVGRLREPLLSPARDEQNGYVPNVVYSCGALVHADTLILPYGIGDSAIGVASVPLDELLGALQAQRSIDRQTTNDWRTRCPTDHPRNHRERNLESPSRRNEGRRRRSEKSETRRLIAWDWGAESIVRIAVLAPISWRVPPIHYGPWELFASLLTEGLVSRGHDVTLFATG